MKKEKIIALVEEFYNKVIVQKPSYKKMREEVKFMGLKLRPLKGDLVKLALKDQRKLVKIVWFIGKLDEFLKKRRKGL